eukprot:4321426-Pleurochrysis_carterae.AAC.1
MCIRDRCRRAVISCRRGWAEERVVRRGFGRQKGRPALVGYCDLEAGRDGSDVKHVSAADH